jgi:N-methylhydantoinase A
VFSASGIAGADVVAVAQASDPMIAPFDVDRLDALYRRLEADVAADLEADGISPGDATLLREIELRYRGQVHEVRVPVPNGRLEPGDLDGLIAEFEARYTRRYGRGTVHSRAGIEARTYAVRGIGRLRKPELASDTPGDADAQEAWAGERDVVFREPSAPAGIYRWEKLRAGHVVSGPAVIEGELTSALVPPDYTARVDGLGNLLLAGPEQR